jgi:hypothetical protein
MAWINYSLDSLSACSKTARFHAARRAAKRKSQRWESNPQPPHYECGALPIEATLALVLCSRFVPYSILCWAAVPGWILVNQLTYGGA